MKLSTLVSYNEVILVKFTAKTLSVSEISDPSALKNRAEKWWVGKADTIKSIGNLIVSYEGEIIAAYKCGQLDRTPKENSICFKADEKGHMRMKLQLTDNKKNSSNIIGRKIIDNARWPFRVIKTHELELQ